MGKKSKKKTPGPTAAELARDEEFGKALEKARLQERVREELAWQRAERGWTEPATAWSLKEELAEDVVPLPYTIGTLHPTGGNSVIAAQYKVGKTTLMANLVKSYADEEKFLGEFPMHTEGGHIAFFNYELPPDMFRQYVEGLEIENPDRVHPLHLRGSSFDLRSPSAFRFAVQWLKDRECTALILDPYGAASRLKNENDNSEARLWLGDCVDGLKVASGVRDVFMPAHTGRGFAEEGQEHVRGASALDDWADVRWSYTWKFVESDGHKVGRRYLQAHGRGVDMPERGIGFDKEDGSLYVESYHSRAVDRMTSGVGEVVRVVRDSPGITVSDLRHNLSGDTGRRNAAVKQAVSQGLIRTEKGKKNAALHYLVEAE